MPSELLQKLESRIDNAIESIELLRLQIEELEVKNAKLFDENSILKDRQSYWEKNLNLMLDKLDTIENIGH